MKQYNINNHLIRIDQVGATAYQYTIYHPKTNKPLFGRSPFTVRNLAATSTYNVLFDCLDWALVKPGYTGDEFFINHNDDELAWLEEYAESFPLPDELSRIERLLPAGLSNDLDMIERVYYELSEEPNSHNVRKALLDLVEYDYEITPCDIHPNDHLEDTSYVIDQLESGNDYAWFDVIVTGKLGPIKFTESLGACSYNNRADWESSDYYKDMLSEVREQFEAIL